MSVKSIYSKSVYYTIAWPASRCASCGLMATANMACFFFLVEDSLNPKSTLSVQFPVHFTFSIFFT